MTGNQTLVMRMRFSATVVILVWACIFLPRAASAKAWKGLVPLHSTRADVQKLLGPPTLEDAGYEVDGERVRISYSSQGCREGLPGGWKVPADTVVSIAISPAKEIKLADVLVPEKKYEQIYAVDTPHVDYVNLEEGIRYASLDGSVLEVTYSATESDDKKLRCGEYKYAGQVPAGAKNKFEQIPYDSYGKIPFEDAEARLDNFMIQLQTLNEGKPHYRGFIIVYAGRSAYAAEAGTIAECSKKYLISARNATPDMVIAADGGYRDEFTVELYIMPNDAYPPLLMPTVSPKQIEVLPGHVSPCPIPE